MAEAIFEKVLEMSLVGSYCILLALPVRLMLLKCGRKYAYYLWLAVFLNLAVPFALHGKYSLIPRQVIELSVMEEAGETEMTGGFSEIRDSYLPEKTDIQVRGTDAVNTVRETAKTPAIRDMMNVIWFAGLCGIGLFSLCRIRLVKRTITRERWAYRDENGRIVEIQGLSAPFLWGVLKPVIFLPSGLEEGERKYIVAHENCHRRRQDPALKIAVFIVAAIHWFNPFVWLAWALFCVDMEISCDEAVLADAGKNKGRDIKKQYAQSLLKYAAAQNGYMMAPLTFGEPSVKTRIKNVLHFRKKNIVTGTAAAVIVAAAALGMVVRPVLAESIHLPYAPVIYPETGGLYKPQPQDDFADVDVRRIEGIFSDYFTPGLRSEEELDALARRALRELYDLTGYRVESCVYGCTDLGSFYFALTEEDLIHSLTFYSRNFGERDGYDPLVIESMGVVYAGQVWFSRVQWFSPIEKPDASEELEAMSDGELAVWYLERSAIWRGEEPVSTEYRPEEDAIRVYLADESFYDVSLEGSTRAISTIYGPYPAGASH